MKKTILLLLLFASRAWGAVGFDNSATNTISGTAATITLTMSSSGSNRLVLCAIHYNSTDSVTAFTYNSVAMTQSALGKIDTGSGAAVVDVWYMKAQPTGSQTVSVTLSATGAHKILTCMSFTGVDQTTPIGTGASYSGYDDPAPVTVTVPSSGMAALFGTYGSATNAGAHTVDSNSSPAKFDLADTESFISGIGSVTSVAGSNAQTVSNAVPDYVSLISLPLNQSTGGAVVVRHRPIVMQ